MILLCYFKNKNSSEEFFIATQYDLPLCPVSASVCEQAILQRVCYHAIRSLLSTVLHSCVTESQNRSGRTREPHNFTKTPRVYCVSAGCLTERLYHRPAVDDPFHSSARGLSLLPAVMILTKINI